MSSPSDCAAPSSFCRQAVAVSVCSMPGTSSQPIREGGFTFEVQQVTAENLCRGFVVKTLSGSVIIGTHQGEQALIGQRGQISFPRQSSAHASDGVFNAALLPRCMRVAEKGAHR